MSDQTSQSKNVIFSNFFGAMQVLGVSTLRKKVFAATLAKNFFLQGSNDLDSLVFWNTNLGDVKGYSLSKIDFLNFFVDI